MKKVLFFFLFLVMPLAAMADESGVIISSFKYDLYDDGTAKLTKYQYWSTNWPKIPETVNYQNRTYTVTTIGYQAFANCSTLQYITIPNSVTTIESWAFVGSSLQTITIPESVTEIQDYTFDNCISLSTVTLPEGLTKIGNHAFSRSGLTQINFPSTLTTIGSYAFENCSSMVSIQSYIVEPFNLGTNAFSGMGRAEQYYYCYIYVPYGTKNAYIAKGWDTSSTVISERNRSGQTLSLNTLPTMVYGDGDYSLPSETAQGLPLTWSVEDESVAIISSTNDRLIIMGAGTTTVTATQAGNNEYQPFVRNFTLTVNKFPLNITAVNKTMEYGDAVPAYELIYSGFVNGETSSVLTSQPTITCSATNTSNVGNYSIVPSGASASNYNISYFNGTLTINKAPLTITANSYTINQKDELPEYGVTYDGFKNDETSSVLTTLPTITCDATDSETVGAYDITPSGAAATNYSFNYVSGTLTVNAVESVTIAMKTGGGVARSMIAYSSKYALDFTSRPELKAYIACGYNDKKEVLLVHVKVVPPYTGMVIKTSNGIYDGGEYDVPTTTEEYYYVNLLVPVVETGTVTPTETIADVEYTNLTIGTLVGGGIGFVRLTSNWTTHNKSYLRIPTALYNSLASARGFGDIGVEFVEGEEATGILNAKRNALENNGNYYDLLGRKVKPIGKGLYIHNGKKVLVK